MRLETTAEPDRLHDENGVRESGGKGPYGGRREEETQEADRFHMQTQRFFFHRGDRVSKP